MNSSVGTRPVPVATLDSAPFWAAARRHELSLQWCPNCRNYRYPPGPICPQCLDTAIQWRQLSGEATLYSWAVVCVDLIPGISPPYIAAEVELIEQPGLLMITQLVNTGPDQLRLGMGVRVKWFDVDGEWTLPLFVPSGVGVGKS